MTYIGANLVAIAAATLVGLLIGAVHQAVLNRPQLRTSGPWLWVVALLSEFWLAAILAGALILAPVDAGPWTVALATPVVIWIGFVLPILAVSYPARGVTWSVLSIDAAHWFVVMVAQATVLHAIGLTRP